MRGKIKRNSGAATAEAALVMPVVLCVLFAFMFLVKIVNTYGLIQHAIDETASEIASAGYFYYISGAKELHDAIRSRTSAGEGNNPDEQINVMPIAVDILAALAGQPTGDGRESRQEYQGEAGNATDPTGTADEPGRLDEIDVLKEISGHIFGGMLDDAETTLFAPLVKQLLKKHLLTDKVRDAGDRLEMLHIKGGFDGLDFGGSSFFSDEEGNIDIIVRYRIELPLPIKIFSGIEIVQRAKARAWMGGDEPDGILDGVSGNSGEDIWSMGNFKRGLKIRRMFGANLPDSFPVIAKYEDGRAVMIKSMDLTAESYRSGEKAGKKLKEYIDELAEYEGREKPWGNTGIVILPEEIRERELLLIIPENKLSEENERMLADMTFKASRSGIKLVIKRHGMKMEETENTGAINGQK